MRIVEAALLIGTILCSVSAVRAQAKISIGIVIGTPPPPRVVFQPAQPGPDFVWVEGYWYPVGRQYSWHEGYWTRPPYSGARRSSFADWFQPLRPASDQQSPENNCKRLPPLS